MRKALIVVDVQPGFVTEQNGWIIPNIQKLLRESDYTVCIEALFHAEPDSLWKKQLNWTFPLSDTVPEIKSLLPAGTVTTTKTTKSAFKGDKDIYKLLKDSEIEEVHIVGIDTHDCVFATAQESFDFGFPTYVLRDGTEASERPDLRDAALAILDYLGMVK